MDNAFYVDKAKSFEWVICSECDTQRPAHCKVYDEEKCQFVWVCKPHYIELVNKNESFYFCSFLVDCSNIFEHFCSTESDL